MTLTGLTLQSTRGSHDCGTIVGRPAHHGDVYVPRAFWTEAVESPMRIGTRTVGFDAGQFLKEEEMRVGGKDRMKTYLLGKWDGVAEAKAEVTRTMRAEAVQERAALAADSTTGREEEVEKRLRNTRDFRAGLDIQKLQSAQARAERRVQEDQDSKAIAPRLLYAVHQEALAQELRCRDTRDNANANHAAGQVRMRRNREERQQEIAQHHELSKYADVENDTRLALHAERKANLEKALKRGEENLKRYPGFDNSAEVRIQEQARELEARESRFLAEREMRRGRQEQQVVDGLHAQVSASEKRKLLDKQMDQMRGHRIRDSCTAALNADMAKLAKHKELEIQSQESLLNVIAYHQAKEERQGYKRPVQIDTLHELASSLRRLGKGTLVASRSRSVPRLSNSAAEPKEIKHWVDISRPLAFGGPVGTFAGEGGATTISLKASGGLKRIATAA